MSTRRTQRKTSGGKGRGITWEKVRELALALPGMEEGSAYGTPAFRIKGKFFARLKEDGESFVLKIGFEEREMLMQAAPETFFITDHYRGYPAVLVRLAAIDPGSLGDLLEQAWRQLAPKRLVAEHDQAKGESY